VPEIGEKRAIGAPGPATIQDWFKLRGAKSGFEVAKGVTDGSKHVFVSVKPEDVVFSEPYVLISFFADNKTEVYRWDNSGKTLTCITRA